MKRCFKCGEVKLLADFYQDKKMRDGVVGKCKKCTIAKHKNRYYLLATDPSFMEKQRIKDRDRRSQWPVGTCTAINNKHFEKYPEKRKARILSQMIVVNGEKHHWSYKIEHAKDVIDLSRKQHSMAHRFIIYDTTEKKYRRFDNNELLDTKEKHEQFIRHIIEFKEYQP